MVSKNRIGRVAGVALTAGVLAVAGLGVGTASADNDGGAAGSGPAAQRMRDQQRIGPSQQAGRPQQGPRIQPGPPGPQQGGPNISRPVMQRPANRPAQAPNAANNVEATRARGIIAATAEVLAVQPQSVLAGLEQGQTLTQVAASHGLSREFFLSELVNQVEKDIKDGQRFGIPASANLPVQLANVIDEPGLGLRGSALSNLF